MKKLTAVAALLTLCLVPAALAENVPSEAPSSPNNGCMMSGMNTQAGCSCGCQRSGASVGNTDGETDPAMNDNDAMMQDSREMYGPSANGGNAAEYGEGNMPYQNGAFGPFGNIMGWMYGNMPGNMFGGMPGYMSEGPMLYDGFAGAPEQNSDEEQPDADMYDSEEEYMADDEMPKDLEKYFTGDFMESEEDAEEFGEDEQEADTDNFEKEIADEGANGDTGSHKPKNMEEYANPEQEESVEENMFDASEESEDMEEYGNLEQEASSEDYTSAASVKEPSMEKEYEMEDSDAMVNEGAPALDDSEEAAELKDEIKDIYIEVYAEDTDDVEEKTAIGECGSVTPEETENSDPAAEAMEEDASEEDFYGDMDMMTRLDDILSAMVERGEITQDTADLIEESMFESMNMGNYQSDSESTTTVEDSTVTE